MKMNIILLVVLSFISFGCINQGKVSINIPSANKSLQIHVSNIQIIDNKLIITGSNLSRVKTVKIHEQSANKNFSIESQSATKIIANSTQATSLDISKMLSVILSDANASSTFPINFSLCDSTLGDKLIDCSMSPQDGDVLAYDQSTDKWKPTNVPGVATPVIGINGYAKLTLNSSEPIACNASSLGSLAMNDDGDLCTCKPSEGGWINYINRNACVWTVPACPSTVIASGLTAGQNSDSCRCSAAQTMTGSVSGSSDSYTDSSSICMAALHAGKINSSGGIIIFRVRAGEASYTGTTSNGITSTSSGPTTLKLQFDEIIFVMFPGYKFYKGRFAKI